MSGHTRLFGRSPDMRAGHESLWALDDHATLFIEPDGNAIAFADLPDAA
jgi:hypothetical protein